MTMLPTLIMACTSALLVGVYRWLALHFNWMDTPNHRSSHQQLTPRGAGLVFAVLVVGAAVFGMFTGHLAAAICLSIAAGIGIALLGWGDDIGQVPAAWRFIGYWLFSLAALAGVYWGISAHSNQLSPTAVLTQLLLCSMALQWLINLYNFMDGINGIAGIEAIYVLAASLLLGSDVFLLDFGWLIAAAIGAVGGFLIWNFPRSQVFMGDAGSAFLGFLLGLLLVWSHWGGGPQSLVWLILLGVFIVDASYTLLVRIATGQAYLQPHRLHAYQILARRWDSHARVVTAVMAVNLGWLLPLAWLAQKQVLAAYWVLLIAYLPLIVACRWLGAGQAGDSRV